MSHTSAKSIIKLAKANKESDRKPSMLKAFGPAVGFGALGGFGKTTIARQSEGAFHKMLGLGRSGRGGLAGGIPYGNPKEVDDALKRVFSSKKFKGAVGRIKKELWRQYAHAPSGLARAFSAGVLGIPLAYGAALAAKELNKG